MSRRHAIAALLLLAPLLLAAMSTAARPSPDPEGWRVAVAPFEGDRRRPSVAERVTDALALRPHARLLPPGSFVAEPGLEPSADAVRGWAYNAAVDDLVLGRVVSATEFTPERIEIVVRSGHSGAERARHVVRLDDGRDLDRAVEALAVEVLGTLGVAPAAEAPPAAPGVAPDGAPSSSTSARGGGRGLDASLALSGFDGKAPIEIKADAAEIVNRERGRELIFQRNVLVRQANVTLRSDRLEASYPKGESEPERLVAQGHVSVDQGDRRARCDRAIYRRAAQRLTCSGHAELVQGCDVVRGESIEFHLADDRARVEGAASIVIRPNREDGTGCRGGEGVL